MCVAVPHPHTPSAFHAHNVVACAQTTYEPAPGWHAARNSIRPPRGTAQRLCQGGEISTLASPTVPRDGNVPGTTAGARGVTVMNRIIRPTTIWSIAACMGLFAAGCSGNKDASTRALRSQNEGLRSTLEEAQDAFRAAEKERDDLAAANLALNDRVAYLEEFNHQETARLQALRNDDVAQASKRVRDLADQAHALRREIERREDEKQRFLATIEQQDRSISSMEVSLDAERKQAARLESEKAALAEQLKETRRHNARMAGIAGVLTLGSVATIFVARGRKRQESREPEATPRFQTGTSR